MNIIRQFLAFDDYLLYNQKLSSGQIALWRALVSINNKAGWADWFTAANATLETLSGLSRSGINKNRNSLKQLGLIDFRSNGKKATSYHVTRLYTSDSTQGSTQEKALSSNSVQQSTQQGVQGSVQQSTQQSAHNSSTLNKQNKTKQKENKEIDNDNGVYPAELIQQLYKSFPSGLLQGAISKWLQQWPREMICIAIQASFENGCELRGLKNYIERILKNWKESGIDTPDKAIEANKKFKERKSVNKSTYQQPPKKQEEMPDWQSLAGPIESDPQRKAEIDWMMKEYFNDQED